MFDHQVHSEAPGCVSFPLRDDEVKVQALKGFDLPFLLHH